MRHINAVKCLTVAGGFIKLTGWLTNMACRVALGDVAAGDR